MRSYQNNLNPSEQKKGKYGTRDFSRSATNSLENETPGKVFKFHHSTEVMKIDDPPLTFVSHWKNSRAPSFKRGKRKRFSFASESNLTTSIALLILLFGSNIQGCPRKRWVLAISNFLMAQDPYRWSFADTAPPPIRKRSQISKTHFFWDTLQFPIS